MKGYELYSWQAEGQWRFTLMTGTNRLKSLEEITAGEDIVTADGWVRLSAQGVEGIKGILGRLPANELILWAGEQWLGQAASQAGKIALPPQGIIDAVTEHCRQLGLELSVLR